MAEQKDAPKKPPEKAPQMGGMAGEAQKKLRVGPAYRDYQMMKMSAGEKPVSLEDWMAGKR